MRRVLMFLLTLSIAAPTPAVLAARRSGADGSSLSGTASDAGGHSMANSTVQLRNLTTGQISATTTSNAAGEFAFTDLAAGSYSVEVVDVAGAIVGSSASIAVGAAAVVSGVAVTASVVGAVAGTAGILGSTAALVTLAAAGAAVAGVAVAANRPTASPSR